MRYEVVQEEMIIYPNLNVSCSMLYMNMVYALGNNQKKVCSNSAKQILLRLLCLFTNHIKDAQNSSEKKNIYIFRNHVPVSISIHFLEGMFSVCIHGNKNIRTQNNNNKYIYGYKFFINWTIKKTTTTTKYIYLCV